MFMNLSMIFIFMIIALIMMLICSIISKKTFMDREKNSPFECGFDPMNSARIPFSLHFFLIAMIFLIFDVEITLIFPLIMVFNMSILKNWIFINMFFMMILLLGIYHEWNQGALNWTN
uniref:NADH dehydrogenase subunit 3 n=1 Tax=Sininocellia chikun TaxID=3018585 RepID=UPI0022FD4967|nr:NADH dehydrogenase subunit 3 [Sininocellia chikun]WBK02699.1 NADH dehydrogenase subunit 3 [Sininocellia chikun]